MNTDLYLIIKMLQCVIPDDIINKIVIILLGISRTNTANGITKYRYARTCGMQYEITPQQSRAQDVAMMNIRISQFDASVNKRQTVGARTNIKRYMKKLDDDFKQRFRFLYC